MRNIFLLCVVALGLCVSSCASTPKNIAQWSSYEVTTNAVGQNGTKFMKVWGFGKSIDKAIEQAKKNAVHACLFRGIPGTANARSTPAIFAQQNGQQMLADNYDYFLNFFEKGKDYLAYVNLTTDGVPSGQDRREVKGGYKVGIDVQVMYDNLRQKMESDGLLQKKSKMFNN